MFQLNFNDVIYIHGNIGFDSYIGIQIWNVYFDIGFRGAEFSVMNSHGNIAFGLLFGLFYLGIVTESWSKTFGWDAFLYFYSRRG